MPFERILALLFATTVVMLFSLLLFFTAIGEAGNGGEYWGFNGAEDPARAASRVHESGDHRLLRVELTPALGDKISALPLDAWCNGEPYGEGLPSRASVDQLIHGIDSVERATAFAARFNQIMAIHIGEVSDPRCRVLIGRSMQGPLYAPERYWAEYVVLAIYVILIGTAYILWPGRRFFKRRLEFVQSKIREREEVIEREDREE